MRGGRDCAGSRAGSVGCKMGSTQSLRTRLLVYTLEQSIVSMRDVFYLELILRHVGSSSHLARTRITRSSVLSLSATVSHERSRKTFPPQRYIEYFRLAAKAPSLSMLPPAPSLYASKQPQPTPKETSKKIRRQRPPNLLPICRRRLTTNNSPTPIIKALKPIDRAPPSRAPRTSIHQAPNPRLHSRQFLLRGRWDR